MANHQQAKKRNRQNIKKRARNYSRRARVHSAERQLRQALDAKDKVAIEEQLTATISEIMRARSKGVLHSNTASRKISRLSRNAHRVLSK